MPAKIRNRNSDPFVSCSSFSDPIWRKEDNHMRPLFSRSAIRTLSIAFAASFAFAGVSHAQMAVAGGQQATPVNSGVDSLQSELHMLTDVQKQGGAQDPAEANANAYKAFYKANEPTKKIELGNSFLQKYPKSALDEPVDVGLLNIYYAQQDWKDVYASADRALALKPDDLFVLTTVGWVIPHVSQPSDADADQLLDKAETYFKHAIAIMPTMSKPSYMNDAQFAEFKTQAAIQAHSALGLVDFRRGDYEDSVKELQQSSPSIANPDATDLYVLGIDFQNLNRFADAADVYGRCGQIAGPLQDRCKQSAGCGEETDTAVEVTVAGTIEEV
jgi:tetratricopeptide (TPR) repeat protein